MNDAEPRRLDDCQLQRIAKALADPQRFAILERISAESEVACKTLVGEFSIKQATISHHLKELSAAGLVDAKRSGQCVRLSTRREVLRAYLDEVGRRMLSRTSGFPA